MIVNYKSILCLLKKKNASKRIPKICNLNHLFLRSEKTSFQEFQRMKSLVKNLQRNSFFVRQSAKLKVHWNLWPNEKLLFVYFLYFFFFSVWVLLFPALNKKLSIMVKRYYFFLYAEGWTISVTTGKSIGMAKVI